MRAERARFYLERVLATCESELDCAGLTEVIERYVEAVALDKDAAERFPGVAHHRFECPDCDELVSALTQMVQLEEAGSLPQIDELWAQLREMVEGDPADGVVPAKVVQTPPAPRPARRPIRWSRPSWFPSTPLTVLVPAALAIALVASAAGWHGSQQETLAAERLMNQLHELRTVRSVILADGSRATVFFHPQQTYALVLLPVNPAMLGDGATVHCWVTQSAQGKSTIVAMACARAWRNWWLVTSDRPMAEYDTLAMAAGTNEAPMFELPLVAETQP